MSYCVGIAADGDSEKCEFSRPGCWEKKRHKLTEHEEKEPPEHPVAQLTQEESVSLQSTFPPKTWRWWLLPAKIYNNHSSSPSKSARGGREAILWALQIPYVQKWRRTSIMSAMAMAKK